MQKAEHAEARGGKGAGPRDPPAMLAGFVRYLEEIGAAELRVEDTTDPGDGKGFDDEACDNQSRIHGCVMIGNRLGLGAPYSRDCFIYGPKSDRLADDLVALSRDRARLYDGVPAAVPDSLDRERFEALVRGRDAKWITVASCAAELGGTLRKREYLAGSLETHDYPREAVMDAISAVEKSGIIGPLE